MLIMTTKFNQLNPQQEELLELLQEELAESIQAICKVKRHGYESINPSMAEHITNRRELEKELGHVMNALNLLIERESLDMSNILSSQFEKRDTVFQYLHHQDIQKAAP